MLFAIKNRLLPTLLLLVVFAAGSLAARAALGLEWNFQVQSGCVTDLLLGGLVMGASDGILHGLLLLGLGQRYGRCFRALVEFFRPQRVPQIVAGGLLAGGEELVFRGTLLEWLRTGGGLAPAAAVALTALVFGLLHLIPRRRLWPFAFWAVWEGTLLGGVYVWSGSLLVVVVLHILHDIGGFSLFAVERQFHGANS
jgi:membrane protease YdiL (CAAX protease family)